MKKRENVLGNVYGRLTVIDDAEPYLPPKGGKSQRKVKVQCSCELKTIKLVNLSKIKSGSIKGCGCLRVEQFKTHGLTNSKEFKTWSGAKGRTTNPKNKSYPDYGGRGVKMYAAWLNDFLAFYNWLKENIGLHPGNGYSLDRIDNDRGYEPGNLRWSTFSEQQLNKRVRKDNISGYKGVHWCKSRNKWVASISIDGVLKTLGRFKTLEEAVVARKEAEG